MNKDILVVVTAISLLFLGGIALVNMQTIGIGGLSVENPYYDDGPRCNPCGDVETGTLFETRTLVDDEDFPHFDCPEADMIALSLSKDGDRLNATCYKPSSHTLTAEGDRS